MTWHYNKFLNDGNGSGGAGCSNVVSSGDLTFKNGVDAGSQKPKGKGVYQLTNKYGANVDGFSPIHDTKEWSPSGDVYVGATISGYSRSGFHDKALQLFNQLERAGERPDQFAFASALPAMAHLGSLDKGRDVLRNVIVEGSQCDALVRSGLMGMYVKWGKMEDAYKVFEKSPERDVIDWNALLSGYVKNGRVDDALELFWAMPERDVVSWTIMITGYAQKGCIDKALELFQRMPEWNDVSWKAMVVGYARSGLVGEAMELFWEMPEWNVVSWTALQVMCRMSVLKRCWNSFGK